MPGARRLQPTNPTGADRAPTRTANVFKKGSTCPLTSRWTSRQSTKKIARVWCRRTGDLGQVRRGIPGERHCRKTAGRKRLPHAGDPGVSIKGTGVGLVPIACIPVVGARTRGGHAIAIPTCRCVTDQGRSDALSHWPAVTARRTPLRPCAFTAYMATSALWVSASSSTPCSG